jgi:hypothetical protein
MAETTYRNRRAVQIENEWVRVTVMAEGGHIAEILDKASGVNPLWTPPWPSIEPSAFDPEKHSVYGSDAESKLLAGIMGHNLCLDIFGGVSAEEAAAGLTVHGEASVAPYEISSSGAALTMRANFPHAQLAFVRSIALDGDRAVIHETVENLTATDRPVGWTQHVTLGPPFIEVGRTRFDAPCTKSKVYEGEFGAGGYMKTAAEFEWPMVPTKVGAPVDLRTYIDAPVSSGYTAHLMDPARAVSYFSAWSPSHNLLFGYAWKQADFPWLGIWEENHSRTSSPWNGQTLTRGMEFGVSPMPETRRQMIDRGSMFGVPGYRWIPARSKVSVRYYAFIRRADGIGAPPDL